MTSGCTGDPARHITSRSYRLSEFISFVTQGNKKIKGEKFNQLLTRLSRFAIKQFYYS